MYQIFEYRMRSLYFGDFGSYGLTNTVSAANRNERFLLRYYNNDISFVLLEKTHKVNKLCHRESVELTLDQCEAIMTGRYDWLKDFDSPLLAELCWKMRYRQLRPYSIVDCSRKTLIYSVCNARISLDSDILVSKCVPGFLISNLVMVPAAKKNAMQIELNSYIPDYSPNAIQPPGWVAETEYHKCIA